MIRKLTLIFLLAVFPFLGNAADTFDYALWKGEPILLSKLAPVSFSTRTAHLEIEGFVGEAFYAEGPFTLRFYSTMGYRSLNKTGPLSLQNSDNSRLLVDVEAYRKPVSFPNMDSPEFLIAYTKGRLAEKQEYETCTITQGAKQPLAEVRLMDYWATPIAYEIYNANTDSTRTVADAVLDIDGYLVVVRISKPKKLPLDLSRELQKVFRHCILNPTY
ncbi:MAG: hypothetical protein JW739_00505 [Opitutales bacterium]|nr:hypothetical protein [Opitutales bacterium]